MTTIKKFLNPKVQKRNDKLLKDGDENFWDKIAQTKILWHKKWTKTKEVSFHKPVSIKWFLDGKLNVCENCVDRHLPENKDKIALIFEQDDPFLSSQNFTYGQMFIEVNKIANVLKTHGVKKGDRVTIYMPMIPQTIFTMLACARIGAIHSVIFGGFSPDSIADRINDCQSEIVITANEGLRGGKIIPLKKNVDEALNKTDLVKTVLVFTRTNNPINVIPNRDFLMDEELKKVSDFCPIEIMDSEDPLFILYTSGSTGKPKGVLHTSGGYLTYASYTHEAVFDYKKDDIYWCTADVGWITGHSYIVYGPLANNATVVIYEGIPNYPTASRFWEIIDKHKVSIFYTAPTALRALMREGDELVENSSHRKSLRILGSVGEPINPEAWHWYYKVIGNERCPIVDTWWQTETGGILISSLPFGNVLKPGSATKALVTIKPKILTSEGVEILTPEAEGVLVLADSWPGQMRTVYKDHERFEKTYFSTYPGYYFTGDGCKRDQDGDYWITGRVDDVLNVSGHRIGTAEIESVIDSHPFVSESAVVGYPHDIKGQGIYVFLTLKKGQVESVQLRQELIQLVRTKIGPIANPDLIQFCSHLPKTRSGKIMRRILRKISENQVESIGDTSTLADPSVVADLIKNKLS